MNTFPPDQRGCLKRNLFTYLLRNVTISTVFLIFPISLQLLHQFPYRSRRKLLTHVD